MVGEIWNKRWQSPIHLTSAKLKTVIDVLLICPTSHRSPIYHHIHSDVSSSSLRIDLQTYDEEHDSNTGTCALLRQFSNRIPEDFVIVPCDFMPPPSLPLSILLNKFRADTLSEACLATTCWYSSQLPDKGTFPEEWGPLPTPSPMIWDPLSGSLLHVDTPDDQDRNGNEIELRMSLLTQWVFLSIPALSFNLLYNASHPHLRLSSRFKDSHVYVCRHSVLDLLHEKPHFISLKEEFFPWLCKVQYRQSKRVKYAKSRFDQISILFVIQMYFPSDRQSDWIIVSNVVSSTLQQ